MRILKFLLIALVVSAVSATAAQPPLGSVSAAVQLTGSGSPSHSTDAALSSVNTGATLVLSFMSTSGSTRTSTAVTATGSVSMTSVVADANCGGGSCIHWWITHNYPGSGTVTFDVEMPFGSTGQEFVVAWELECTATCTTAGSSLNNNTGSTTHYAAASGAIDTAANTSLVASCVSNGGAFVGESPASGWTQETDGDANILSEHKVDVGTAFTDERGGFTGEANSRTSYCGIVGITDGGGGGGGGTKGGRSALGSSGAGR
jgi:hypothetical protein